MGAKEIHKLLADGERITLECKKAQGGLPNSMWETYSAFANTYGGTILLGVAEDLATKDKAKRFTIVGVNDADKIRKDLWNTVNNQEKVNVNLFDEKDVQTVNVDGKDVVVICVPRASYDLRPVYINGNMMKGAFCRNHEGDYHCTPQMVKLMVRDSFEEGNDRMLIEYYGMDDIDIPTLEGYRMMFKTSNPEHI